jgi:DHA2 family multidrug resistance protein
MFAMLMANMFLLPVFMQEMLGFTATQSGVHMMPRSLVMIAVTPLIGRLYNHVSPRLLVALGVVAFSVGAYQMSHFTLDTGTSQIVTALVWQGIGFSLLFVPLTTVALSRIPRARLTDATGLNSLFRQIGGSVGLAIFATALSRSATRARASLSAHLSLTSPDALFRLQQIQQALTGRGMDPASAQAAAPAALAAEVARQAMVISFEKMFLLAGICFMAILPLLLFLKVDRSAESGSAKPEVHLEM